MSELCKGSGNRHSYKAIPRSVTILTDFGEQRKARHRDDASARNPRAILQTSRKANALQRPASLQVL